MVTRALWGSVLGLAACFPPPLDETGKNCQVDRPCGDGFTCFDLHCAANGAIDAGPANWLPNSDFEQLTDAGGIVAWRVWSGELEADPVSPHQGSYAARIFSDDGGTPALVTQTAPVKNTLSGQVWCARAWTRAEYAGDAGLVVGLFIRERHDDGGVTDSTPARPHVFREWVALEERYVTEGAERLDTRVAFTARAKKGEAVVVDEVALKRTAAADGVCRW